MQEQTIHRLYILDFGLFEVHENGRQIGIPGYLIQTHDGRNILVDTGFPDKYVVDPEQATFEDSLENFGKVLSLTKAQCPAGQLAMLGLTHADIDMLVMTHTDIDHVGAIADFAHVPIVIGVEDRAQPHPRYWAGRSPISWPNAQYNTIDSDMDLLPGIRLLTTPGHAPGHLSLLIRLPESGSVLLTGDAISRPAELTEGYGGVWNADLAAKSAAKLMAIAEQEDAFVIYGHDPDQWPRLRKAPAYYG